MAEQAEEEKALSQRLKSAEEDAVSRSCLDVLNNFGAAVFEAKAVLARSLSAVDRLVKGELYITFHSQVRSGSRIPENNDWDSFRASVEAAILPYCYDKIHFAALSIDGRGIAPYGPFFIVLKERMIAHRSSVFEQNPFMFLRQHGIVAGTPIPRGYRATWYKKDELAKAKLHTNLAKTTTSCEFSNILLDPGFTTGDGDFIEVHIYGPIDGRAIERVVGPKPPRRGPDLAMWTSLERALNRAGAILEAL